MAEGYIWLGTDDGVYRFNGRNVTHMADSAEKAVTAIAMYGNTIFTGHADGHINMLADGQVCSLQDKWRQAYHRYI